MKNYLKTKGVAVLLDAGFDYIMTLLDAPDNIPDFPEKPAPRARQCECGCTVFYILDNYKAECVDCKDTFDLFDIY